MRVHEALELFGNIPKIRRCLANAGRCRPRLFVPGPGRATLSGGEAQRVKLAAELARPSTGRTLYILDEPTTGLHFDDIHKLLEVLNRLVDLGNTVIVVEHNLDVIKTADWMIDLGPEAGPWAAASSSQGTPETVAADVRVQEPHRRRTRTDLGSRAARRTAALRSLCRRRRRAGRRRGTGSGRPRRGHAVADRRPTLAHRRARHQRRQAVPLGRRTFSIGSTSASTSWANSAIPIGANEPSSRLPRRVGAKGWFLHAMTGQEWLLRLVFRVEKNRFKDAVVCRRTWHPAAKRDARTGSLRQRRARVDDDPQGAVAVGDGPRPSAERDRHACLPRIFARKRPHRSTTNLKRLQTKPEDVMPWKVNGERWHLGEKGFPPGKKVRGERSLLTRLLQLVREVEPGVLVRWDARCHHAASARSQPSLGAMADQESKPHLSAISWGRRANSISVKSRILALRLTSAPRPKDGDLLSLHFQKIDQEQAHRLKNLLSEHMQGFRDFFAK